MRMRAHCRPLSARSLASALACHLHLHCTTHLPIIPQVTLYASDATQILGDTETDENGVFMFPRIACGSYILFPVYKDFQVTPAQMNVDVGASDKFVTEPFRFMGFALKGTVVGPDGQGIPDVMVAVHSQKTGAVQELVTDATGHYTASQLSVGQYTVSAKKQHLSFKKLNQVCACTTHSTCLGTQPSRIAFCRVQDDPGHCHLVTAPSAHPTTPHHTTPQHATLTPRW